MSHYGNQRHRGNKVVFGLVVIIIGVFILLRQTGLFPYVSPHIFFPSLMIVIGLMIGIKTRFRSIAAYILVALGIFHLVPGFSFTVGGHEVDSEELAVPAILILAGLFIILRSGKKKHWSPQQQTDIIAERSIDADVIFGGRKEIVTSKDFKGGRITATFGGAEINMLQADSTDQVIVLEVRATFGGCEIIVPSSWDIRNEVETILGSVEDKRTLRTPESSENRKTLVLRGSCFCGGIEIKSF